MISHDMDKWITGLFKDKAAAERAVDALQAAGYDVHDVSVMMSEDTRVRNFTMDAGSKAAEGATAGGIVGGAIGAVVAGLTATGSVAIVAASGVGLGPVVAGPLAAALAGLGAGALSGGVIGALAGLGVPEVRAREIEKQLDDGGIVVGVRTDSANTPQAQAILNDVQADVAERKARSARDR